MTAEFTVSEKFEQSIQTSNLSVDVKKNQGNEYSHILVETLVSGNSLELDDKKLNYKPLSVLVETEDCSITFNPVTREILKNGETLARLTKSPARLLLALTENPNEFVPSSELAMKIWSDNFGRESGIHNLVSRVRETLRLISPLLEGRVGSKRNGGYVWVTDNSLVSPSTTN